MKKITAVFVCFLFLLGLTGPTFASDKKHKLLKSNQESAEIIKGKVVSIDKATRTILIKEDKTQTDRSFTVSEKTIGHLKAGDEVKLKIKEGNNHAESVKVVSSGLKQI